ncbi:hypothetical protein T12_1280 [Trichinella patagoniensis]|uniref:Uncharacterized protein n=1 Tax=Trichinella patagoniensis TaxID=990121 RepID=A0A0V0YYL7_9BILA|nr:hypothetical protein T12_1280 [Trichinella patagoniensis]
MEFRLMQPHEKHMNNMECTLGESSLQITIGQKETIEQLTISYLPITSRVSEKRLREHIFDEMRSDTPPR